MIAYKPSPLAINKAKIMEELIEPYLLFIVALLLIIWGIYTIYNLVKYPELELEYYVPRNWMMGILMIVVGVYSIIHVILGK